MIRRGTALHRIDECLDLALRRLSTLGLPLLAALALVTLALGTIGFCAYSVQEGSGGETIDQFYRALQLFVLQAPDRFVNLPASLQIARFLAAAFTFIAALSIVGRLFFDQFQIARLWLFARGHIILCGLGEKGITLVRDLRALGFLVVVIESDPNHPDLRQCRGLGALLLPGSSTEAWVLRKARVHRASVLMAFFRDDRLNVETVVVAHELVGDRARDRLRCLLQVAEPGLLTVLHKHPMMRNAANRFVVEPFNMYDACARSMLREGLIGLDGFNADHILVVGMGGHDRLGELVILRAARNWHIENPPSSARLRIEVIDPEATRRVRALREDHGFLDRVVEFVARDISPTSARIQDASIGARDGKPPGAAFLCTQGDTASLIAAEHLRDALPTRVPILVRTLERDAGLGALLKGRASDNLIGVGVKDKVRELALSLGPQRELLAQAVHQEYFAQQRRTGRGLGPEGPAVRFWSDLPEEYRESSRAQADDIERKLNIVGCRPEYQPDGLIELHAFTADEIELLAREEHERWRRERAALEWRYGVPRDNVRRLHPNLVPWDDPRLTDDVKNIDRRAVARIPAMLATADYRVVRIENGDSQ